VSPADSGARILGHRTALRNRRSRVLSFTPNERRYGARNLVADSNEHRRRSKSRTGSSQSIRVKQTQGRWERNSICVRLCNYVWRCSSNVVLPEKLKRYSSNVLGQRATGATFPREVRRIVRCDIRQPLRSRTTCATQPTIAREPLLPATFLNQSEDCYCGVPLRKT
jgi:hypothetical protein